MMLGLELIFSKRNRAIHPLTPFFSEVAKFRFFLSFGKPLLPESLFEKGIFKQIGQIFTHRFDSHTSPLRG